MTLRYHLLVLTENRQKKASTEVEARCNGTKVKKGTKDVHENRRRSKKEERVGDAQHYPTKEKYVIYSQ